MSNRTNLTCALQVTNQMHRAESENKQVFANYSLQVVDLGATVRNIFAYRYRGTILGVLTLVMTIGTTRSIVFQVLQLS